MATDIKHEGWLGKKRRKGVMGITIFQKRWVTLREHMFDDIRMLEYAKAKGEPRLGAIEFKDMTGPPVMLGIELHIHVPDRDWLFKCSNAKDAEKWFTILKAAYQRHLGAQAVLRDDQKTVLSSSTTSGGGRTVEIGKQKNGIELATKVRVMDERKGSTLGVITVECYLKTTVAECKNKIREQCKRRGKDAGLFHLSVRYKHLADNVTVLGCFTEEDRKNKALQMSMKELDKEKIITTKKRKKKKMSSDDDTDDSDTEEDDAPNMAAITRARKESNYTQPASMRGRPAIPAKTSPVIPAKPNVSNRSSNAERPPIPAKAAPSTLPVVTQADDELAFASDSDDDGQAGGGFNPNDYPSSSEGEEFLADDELGLAPDSDDDAPALPGGGAPAIPSDDAPPLPSGEGPPLPSDSAPPPLPDDDGPPPLPDDDGPPPLPDDDGPPPLPDDDGPPPLPGDAPPPLPVGGPPPI